MAATAVELRLPIPGALPVCLDHGNPYRLVSLLDLMEVFEPHRLLSKIRELQNKARLCFEAQDPQYRFAAIDSFTGGLEEIREICGSLNLPMSSLHASQLAESARLSRKHLDHNNAERIASMLAGTVENELSLRRFFTLNPDRAKHYCEEGENIFGDAVAKAFPSASWDSREAGRCFAVGRFTASVFHLMRALEISLCIMADRFNVPSDHMNWHNIIEKIEKALRNMENDSAKPPDWKEQREFYSQAASHFMVIKDAWRNYTAHARGKYTDEEAETILINVRGFMQKLATRLAEKP